MSWIQAIALDLDGTISSNDDVSPTVMEALRVARYRRVRLLLVTGRTVRAVREVFPGLIDVFDVVVAENGAVLFVDGVGRLLAEPVSHTLSDALEEDGIPLHRGEVLLATSAAHDEAVLRKITDLGLDCALLRNRGELMILPAGVSKGSGLLAALNLLGLSSHNVMAVGDAENDHAMFELAELAAAPANAVPSIKEHADLVLPLPNGEGVAELLMGVVTSGEQRPVSDRRQMPIGTFPDGSPALVPSGNATAIVVGGSGRGKSYLAGLMAEQLIDRRYQILFIDPQGEQSSLRDQPGVDIIKVAVPADARRSVAGLRSGHTVVLDLSSVDPDQVPDVLRSLTEPIAALRAESGIPQWIFIDEAHDLMGSAGPLRTLFDPTAGGHCLITYRPEQLSAEVLADVDIVLSVSPPIDQVMGTINQPASGLPFAVNGQASMLRSDRAESAQPFIMATRSSAHQRHQRKYAQNVMAVGKGFRFRTAGPQVLPEARSVEQFRAQLQQVGPDTLGWHLSRGDLSRWLAEVVQDRELADHVARLERDVARRQQTEISRARHEIIRAIDARYFSGPRVAAARM
ncbi:HAD hydrolase family protein [Nakamurella sp. PAMC28650]|uniref:HAD hydrolase family protein n=1 Tax=Nakamurella sp. PAMC28650 TaxID=2762325 RepID=UPI00164E3031|nr:HAD hydrolase family protein [Nakamurella sp. PAMC28650]QNK80269.1 HAD hydrolase family protein [Nakamurella sp. PAMC28650]